MLTLSNISKHYQSRNGITCVLNNVNLHLAEGELCALTGTSGSGKTTLLNLTGLLDKPTKGSIRIGNFETTKLSTDEIATVRNRCVGFVFQSFHLLPHFTTMQNVCLPLMYRGVSLSERRELAKSALAQVGLGELETRYPDELSGGQRQRVAIARALVSKPSILLADEPTGNLDSRCADEIMSLFTRFNERDGLTVLMVTHDQTIAARCPRRIVMRDGGITDDNFSSPHVLKTVR